jgi:outer membrane protein assembly factor BamA
LILDKRDHRYNASEGTYIVANIINYDGLIGSYYNFYSYEIDVRKYWNPWYEHVIAAQVYTKGNVGNVPFYSLGLLGGTQRMRGYYLGAIRDKLILDSQIEYRMPVWNIFGIVAFANAGRVANDWQGMNLNDLWFSGGLGLRIMVDRTNKANLRIDFGYGQKGSKTIVLGFTEAF